MCEHESDGGCAPWNVADGETVRSAAENGGPTHLLPCFGDCDFLFLTGASVDRDAFVLVGNDCFLSALPGDGDLLPPPRKVIRAAGHTLGGEALFATGESTMGGVFVRSSLCAVESDRKEVAS